MKRKFSVGDKVLVIMASSGLPEGLKGLVGKVVTIRGVDHYSSDGEHAVYGVAFKKNVRGHNLESACKPGHGWWFLSTHLELMF